MLKGALLFQLWYGHPHRPTRDADLLGFGPDDVPTLVGVFQSICGIQSDDGIVFNADSVSGTGIRKDTGYGGVRIDLRATLDGARLALQIDIGFGDAVTPDAQSVIYPTLLEDLPPPALRAYPKATVVAADPDGLIVHYCGIVTLRRQPETASGTVFIPLEDETGVVQVICWKSLRYTQR